MLEVIQNLHTQIYSTIAKCNLLLELAMTMIKFTDETQRGKSKIRMMNYSDRRKKTINEYIN
jgi:hypothetical protein